MEPDATDLGLLDGQDVQLWHYRLSAILKTPQQQASTDPLLKDHTTHPPFSPCRSPPPSPRRDAVPGIDR